MRFEPKIYIKGLILVAVPLILEVVFGITLLNLQRVYDQALDEEAHAKEIIYHANEMWLCCTDAVTSVFEGGALVPDAVKDLDNDVGRLKKEYEVLSELIKNDPEQQWHADRILGEVDSLIALAKTFGQSPAAPGTSHMALLVGSYENFRKLRWKFSLLNTHIKAFRDPILKQTLELRRQVEEVEQTISRLTILSIAGSVLLAAGLYLYFMRGINRGIQVLLANTKRLEGSESLLPALNTTDELGELDRSFHQMSDALRERTLELQRVNAELSRSNSDLQQFAYVASHDLQEPLRAVSSYLDILTRRHGSSLEKEAQSFVDKAQDGAKRMQMLIRDLLAYARVDSKAKEFSAVECNQIASNAMANLKVAIEESGATVTCDDLPVVMADDSQLIQLFQNLIGNAIKFKRDEPPRVNVSATKKDGNWEFAISDNGIGIDMAHADRVFTIFKRLHTRTAYPGTGIGLAICKKIVELHGGRIWIESEPGAGTTFRFTIPDVGRQPGRPA